MNAIAKESDRAARRALNTRKKLFDAALAVFNELGVDACTIEDITERADVGKGTFYKHFPDKYEMMCALVERSLGQLVERLRKQPEPAPQNLDQVMAHLLDAHIAHFTARRDEFLIIFQGHFMVKLRRPSANALEKPFMAYIGVMEEQIRPHLAQPADPAKVRRLACAAAGFSAGFLSVAMTAMPRDDVSGALVTLRQAFLAGMPSFAA